MKNLAEQLKNLLMLSRDRMEAVHRFDKDLTQLDQEIRDLLESSLMRHEARMNGLMVALKNRYERTRQSEVPPIEERDQFNSPQFLKRALEAASRPRPQPPAPPPIPPVAIKKVGGVDW